ncbi:MAG: hypothetical protein AB4426_31505 [Xenococcaceae cyanobacterium]
MTYHLLLAFVLISALTPVSVAALSGDVNAHESIPVDPVKQADCSDDPRGC